MATTTLRVGIVQFAPKIGQVQANIAKVQELCKRLTPRSVDLLCFPEMIFSGYMFPDAASISPYLEHPRTGPTSVFCAEIARRLECYVVAGFPERLEHGFSPPPTTNTTGSVQNLIDMHPSPPALPGANTAILYGPTGEFLSLYRKSNLYKTDLSWATAGHGFTVVDLPPPLGKTTIAICNDLNVQAPAVWNSIEDGPYELARHCVREGTRLLIMLNAWLKSDTDESEDEGEVAENGLERVSPVGIDGDSQQPDWSVLRWWAMRLYPTWARDRESEKVERNEHQTDAKGSQELMVVLSNRFGHEGDITFAGSSAMFLMCRGSGRPQLLHAMGKREEGVKIWTAPIRQ
ncbi:carbon-nitrogen hydrolase [Scleroderma citrinum]